MSAKGLAAALICAIMVAALFGCGGSGTPASSATSSQSGASANGDDLTIAIAGMVTPESGLDYYLGLSKYIGEKVGMPVRLIHKADYTQVNEMLRDGKVDIAYVCSGPYVKGQEEFGLELVAAPVVNGAPEYYSYFIVPKSSSVATLAALKGKVFAYTDPESNTGCLVPNYVLKSAGYDPKTFFKESYFTYGHDNSIKAVATGEADGAAVDSLIYEFMDASGSEYPSETRIIMRSEPFAIPPVVARPDLDPVLVKKVAEAFLSAHEDPEGKALLDKMKIERFVRIDDSAYDSIRRMNERLK